MIDKKEECRRMKTLKGLIHTAVDHTTAAMGWCEVREGREKARDEMKLVIGNLMELEQRLQMLLGDLEGTYSTFENKK